MVSGHHRNEVIVYLSRNTLVSYEAMVTSNLISPTLPLRSSTISQDIIPVYTCSPIRSIDGVLLRSSKTTARAHRTLNYLQSHYIPFILLTNGGGTTEEKRVKDLSRMLNVQLNTSMFVQSHTPFAELAKGEGKENLKEKNVLVVGGEGDNCRQVAKR